MTKKLTLLHSNDLHGDFTAEQIDGKLVGGVSRLSGYINKVRNEEENVIYAIAGDMFRGSVIDSEYKGFSTIEIMNILSPDVVTIGNHEADYGIAHLLFLEKCAKFPIINANLYIKSNHKRLFTPFRIMRVGEINVMFIGILTEEVLSTTKTEAVVGSFVDLWEARKEVNRIIDNYKTTKINLTVLLTHIGIEADRELAGMIDPQWGVDMIIGGHSHTKMDEPEIVNGIPIVQAYTGTDQIGRFDLEFSDNNELLGYKWKTIPINDDNCPRNETLEDMLQSYQCETDKKYLRLVTNFKRTLTHPKRNQETELGNLFADLLQVDSSFDVMFYASGAIRKKELGPIINYRDLIECFPYDSAVVMLEVTGKQFKQIFKHMFRDEMYGDGHTEFYQVSQGVHVEYDYNTKSLDVCQLNGKNVEDSDMIKIAVQNGFHFGSFTEFFGIPVEEVEANKKPRIVITSINSIFEELLANGNNFDSKIEGRLTIKNRPDR